MKLNVGSTYQTKCGNRVVIERKFEVDDENGVAIDRFTGSIVKVIKGHEALLNTSCQYNHEGRWINGEGLVVVNAIHDLKEELRVEGSR